MRRKVKKPRTVERSVKVTAVATGKGPPATTVNVEVSAEELKREVGELGAVKKVLARIPEEDQGVVRWHEEPLTKVGQATTAPGSAPVERFAHTHYGPTDSKHYGIAVDIETEHGVIAAQRSGERHAVRQADKPEEGARTIRSPDSED